MLNDLINHLEVSSRRDKIGDNVAAKIESQGLLRFTLGLAESIFLAFGLAVEKANQASGLLSHG